MREICAFGSRRENNHNTRISQRMAILVHHYQQYHHMMDPHSWLGLKDWFQEQYRPQTSLIARSPKSSRAYNESRRQGSPDGQRQMENCKETRKHNRSAWWQQSQWFPPQLKLRTCRPIFIMLPLTFSCLAIASKALIWLFWIDCAPFTQVFQKFWTGFCHHVWEGQKWLVRDTRPHVQFPPSQVAFLWDVRGYVRKNTTYTQ